MGPSAELARQSSVRTSIVASSLGTREFSFDNIVVNSTVYRKTYNAWRGRSRGRIFRPESVFYASHSNQSDVRTNTVGSSRESEWLIDLSEPQEPIATAQTAHPDLVLMQDHFQTPVKLDAWSPNQQYVADVETAVGDDSEVSLEESDPAAESSVSLKSRPPHVSSTTVFSELATPEMLFLGKQYMSKTRARWTARCKSRWGLWALPGTPLRKGKGDVWHYSTGSRFAAVGEWLRIETPTWSLQDSYEGSEGADECVMTIVVIGIRNSCGKMFEQLMDSLPRAQITREDAPAGKPWRSWKLTSWIGHSSLPGAGHHFVTIYIRESQGVDEVSLRGHPLATDHIREPLLLSTNPEDDGTVPEILDGACLAVIYYGDGQLSKCGTALAKRLRSSYQGPIINLTNRPLSDKSFSQRGMTAIDATANCRVGSSEDVQDFWHTLAVFAFACQETLPYSAIKTSLEMYFMDSSRSSLHLASCCVSALPKYFARHATNDTDDGKLLILGRQAQVLQFQIMRNREDMMEELRKIWDSPESHIPWIDGDQFDRNGIDSSTGKGSSMTDFAGDQLGIMQSPVSELSLSTGSNTPENLQESPGPVEKHQLEEPGRQESWAPADDTQAAAFSVTILRENGAMSIVEDPLPLDSTTNWDADIPDYHATVSEPPETWLWTP